jgi:hypothetical protein
LANSSRFIVSIGRRLLNFLPNRFNKSSRKFNHAVLRVRMENNAQTPAPLEPFVSPEVAADFLSLRRRQLLGRGEFSILSDGLAPRVANIASRVPLAV